MYPDLLQLNMLVASLPALTVDDIEKDIDRTFPGHIQFESEEGAGQASLRRLLRWYVILNTSTHIPSTLDKISLSISISIYPVNTP